MHLSTVFHFLTTATVVEGHLGVRRSGSDPISYTAVSFCAEPSTEAGIIFQVLDGDSDCNCYNHWTEPTPDKKNALIMGDSVAGPDNGYFNLVRGALWRHGINAVWGRLYAKTNAPPPDDQGGYCASSFGTVKCLSAFFGGKQNEKWDVISFNWGLHDVLSKCYGEVSLDAYAKNLRQITDTLTQHLKPGGHLVFQDTTPAPPMDTEDAEFARNNGDVMDVNQVARRVLGNYDPPVPISNLYQSVVDECHRHEESRDYPNRGSCPSMQFKEGNVHFNEHGRNLTGQLVVNSILKVLV